jgi:hypothetical protein
MRFPFQFAFDPLPELADFLGGFPIRIVLGHTKPVSNGVLVVVPLDDIGRREHAKQ